MTTSNLGPKPSTVSNTEPPDDQNELGPKKRSFTIRGHRTSVSLEDDFWECLLEQASKRGLSLAGLVTKIDAERGRVGLSSAVRSFILKDLRDALAAADPNTGPPIANQQHTTEDEN